MSIQMNNNVSFRARVRMRDVKEFSNAMAEATPGLSTGSCITGGLGSSSIGTTASHAAGSAANIVGSAFSAKASGIDSFGIVPSVMESAAGHATPATIASSEAHPSLIGSLFSTIGDFFHSLGRVKVNVKDPSK